MRVKSCFFLTLPFLLVLALGCSSSRTPCSVHGKLSYKGQPLGGGSIIFLPAKEDAGGGYQFNINPDGTYEGGSMPAQEYIVTIDTESAKGSNTSTDYNPGGRGGQGKDKAGRNAYMEQMKKNAPAGAGQSQQPTYVKIPEKYNDKAKSGLQVKLTNGKNKKDFDLTD